MTDAPKEVAVRLVFARRGCVVRNLVLRDLGMKQLDGRPHFCNPGSNDGFRFQISGSGMTD